MVWNQVYGLLALLYLAGLLATGLWVGRKRRSSNQFLNATAALPTWVCIAACIAANCGSLDVIAMMGLGAEYGMTAMHFYWIGAIPALLVLAFWLLPIYARGRHTSVLEFIARRYGPKTGALVSLSTAMMMLLLAGVCLCAVAQSLTALLGWTFLQGVLLTTPVVLFYTCAGGFRATVYTELLHFAVVLLAVVPLLFLVVHGFGGFAHLVASIPPARLHAWQTLPWVSPGASMDRTGLIVGLGIVLGFGYWSTDFVQMQRALAVRSPQAVPYVPLSIATAKLVFGFLIVLPGVVAPLVLIPGRGASPNAVLPEMMLRYYNPSWLAIGGMGLAASLVSTFANNVAGFSAAWVEGVYKPWIRPRATDLHFVRMGRLSSAAAVLLSIGGAYAALSCESMMEYIQMVLSIFNAPLFALVAIAALAPRRAHGGLAGFTTGLLFAGAHQGLVFGGLLHYGSQMSANFYAAILSFSVTTIVTLAMGGVTEEAAPQLVEATPALQSWPRFPVFAIVWASIIAVACLLLNWRFQ